MNLFNTEHKRKALALTTVVMCLVIFILFFAGMKYLDPPPENGVEVIYGVDITGMGERTPPPSAAKQEETQTPQTQPEQSTSQEVKENLLAQDNNEEVSVPEVPKKKEKKKETPKETKPTAKKPQKPAASTTDALSSVLNASVKNPHSGNGSGSQGDDNTPGYKGDPKGNPYASSFYGDSSEGSGQGSGKGWGLNGRKYISGEKVYQDCNESGLVIVQIEVDRSGKVVRAKAGEKGTTNKAPCLLDAARKSAMTYRFNADEKAPQTQIGFLSIRFKLGE